MPEKLLKSDAEWRELLTEEQFQVARQGGTERAFTGIYWDEKRPGIYACICCGTDLFHSDTKYDSHSGWPSFWAPIDPARLTLLEDNSFGMRRIEVQCATCDAHLGHVFPDGPQPTGERFCMNSASLKLTPEA